MKRIALASLILTLLFLITAFLLPNATHPAFAQGPTATLDPQTVLAQAQKASADASTANTNAANAVNIVNLILAFISVAGLLGAGLGSLIAIFGARAGFRTLKEYRDDLTKARKELDDLRTGLNTATDHARDRLENSIKALSLMQLGEQQVSMKNIQSALKMYRQAYELDPDNRATNYFLGELYIQDNQIEEGIEHLNTALSQDPDYAPAEAGLGYALRLQADKATEPTHRDQLYAQSESRFLRALEIDPTVLDLYGESVQAVLGGLYKRQSRYDKAIYRYEEAHKVTPHKSYPVINLGTLYFAEGQLDQATPHYERVEQMSSRALELNPFDYWTRLDRMLSRVALGNLSGAADDLDMILQQVKTPGPLRTTLSELDKLKNAPHPPDGIDDIIQRMRGAVQQLKDNELQPTKS